MQYVPYDAMMWCVMLAVTICVLPGDHVWESEGEERERRGTIVEEGLGGVWENKVEERGVERKGGVRKYVKCSGE
jgi:hypothetical protein